MKKIILLITIIILLSGCNKSNNNYNDLIKVNNEVIVFNDYYLYDLIEKPYNIEILSDNYKIDTETIGNKNIEFIYKIYGKKYKYNFIVKVIDNEAPRVFSGTNKTVTKGYEGDLCNIITYGDNYDGIINCKIDGEYDLNKIGTYNLKYYLSDNSSNTKEVNVKLNVIEKNNNTSNTTSNTKKTKFSYVISKYKTDNNEIGIDVSKWQGDIDFKKVKDAGATFVMMRIGYQKSVNNDNEVDPYFLNNIKNAKEAGLKVGVYFASTATNKEEAISQAEWVVNTLNNEKLDLPISFDWENWSRWNSYKISFHDINSFADIFIDKVKEKGYDGMLYGSKFYLETIWENKYNNKVWLAHYTEKTSYQGKYIMWQLCNNGRIDGINGDVDIDILYNN